MIIKIEFNALAKKQPTLSEQAVLINPIQSKRSFSGRWAIILRFAPAENIVKQPGKEPKAYSETGPVVERFRQVQTNQYPNDDIDKRNEEQDDPPSWPADNLQKNPDIVDRDDGLPSGLACLGKYLPQARDDGKK